MNSSGQYVIAWEGIAEAHGPSVIVGEYLTVDGSGNISEGADFQMSMALDQPGRPSVGIDDSGKVIVAFTNTFTQDQSGADTLAHEGRYDVFSGTTLTGEYYAATGNAVPAAPHTGDGEDGTKERENIVLSMNGAGDCVMVWDDLGDEPYSPTSYGIFGTVIPHSGSSTFNHQVNNVETSNPLDEDFPSVAMDANGNFAVAWTTGVGIDLTIYSLEAVYARRFNLSFSPRSTGGTTNEFRVDPSGAASGYPLAVTPAVICSSRILRAEPATTRRRCSGESSTPPLARGHQSSASARTPGRRRIARFRTWR